MTDEIRPEHYKVGIETWDLIMSYDLDFFEGNVIKYVSRAGIKTPDRIPDYTKAVTYAHKLQTYPKSKNESPVAYTITPEEYINSWDLGWLEGRIVELVCALSDARRRCDKASDVLVNAKKNQLIKFTEKLLKKEKMLNE